MKISFQVNNKDFRFRLKNAIEKLQNLRPLLKKIGAFVVSSILQNFYRQASPDGRPWKQSRRAEKQGGQTLKDTGQLRSSIQMNEPTDTAVFVGTNKEYARVMQEGARKGAFGTVTARVKQHERRISKPGKKKKYKIFVSAHDRRQVVPWGDIPARPFIGLRPGDMAHIQSIVNRFFGEK